MKITWKEWTWRKELAGYGGRSATHAAAHSHLLVWPSALSTAALVSGSAAGHSWPVREQSGRLTSLWLHSPSCVIIPKRKVPNTTLHKSVKYVDSQGRSALPEVVIVQSEPREHWCSLSPRSCPLCLSQCDPLTCLFALWSFQNRFINSCWDKHAFEQLLVMAATPINYTQHTSSLLYRRLYHSEYPFWQKYPLLSWVQTMSLAPHPPQLPSWEVSPCLMAAANLPCTWVQAQLTCYCDVDLSRSRGELSILRKRWDPRSSKWLKAKGVVTGEVT